MARFQTLDDINVRGKRVLLRADLNVPAKDGVVSDATRIERLAPTIKVIEKGAKVIVMSHFGRPDGRPDPAYSLRPLIAPLSQAIGGREVVFAADCIGEEAKRVVAALRPGQVALLENLRFHKGEEENSPNFARALAELGDVYVDDAFSAAHRAHASIAALARLLPAAAGKLLEAELAALTAALESPARPVLALSAAPRCRPSSTATFRNRQGGCPGDWRSDGQHLVIRRGDRNRPLIVRARDGR